MTHSIHFHRTMLHIASVHSRYSFFFRRFCPHSLRSTASFVHLSFAHVFSFNVKWIMCAGVLILRHDDGRMRQSYERTMCPACSLTRRLCRAFTSATQCRLAHAVQLPCIRKRKRDANLKLYFCIEHRLCYIYYGKNKFLHLHLCVVHPVLTTKN